MIHQNQVSPRAAPGQSRRGTALGAFLAALAALVFGVHLLVTWWLANLTVTEWRDAPAGSQLDIFFDEPAHPPWNW